MRLPPEAHGRTPSQAGRSPCACAPRRGTRNGTVPKTSRTCGPKPPVYTGARGCLSPVSGLKGSSHPTARRKARARRARGKATLARPPIHRACARRIRRLPGRRYPRPRRPRRRATPAPPGRIPSRSWAFPLIRYPNRNPRHSVELGECGEHGHMARTRGACGHAPFAGVGRKSEEALVHDEQRAHLLAAASRGIDHAGVDEAPRRVVRIADIRHVSRPLDRAGEGGGHVEVVRFGERELLHACAVVRCRLRIFRERRRAHDDAFRGAPPRRAAK